MSTQHNQASGYLFTFQAFLTWGLLPIYWKLLNHIPALEILAHRIFWSLIFVLLFLVWKKQLKLRSIFANKKALTTLTIAGLLVGSNWGVYIYAVNVNHIVEASLGYYITPLINVALGILFLKERLNKLQLIALLLAASSVIYLTVDYGRFPWISIYLAASFGLYGLLKKMSGVDAMPALAIETMVLTPFALSYIIWGMVSGNGHLFTESLQTDALLIMAGVVTTLPLYWFGLGAKRISLTSVGFMQYIAPTIMLLLGLFIYHEGFPQEKQVAFAAIWMALAIYSYSIIVSYKKKQQR
ncbi:EamA family transporter RarD [Carboxylicivirga sediminis]|uniref:EamA family transporter RarD n=1 Tax=Carboxylicivirga sediminis TaxID=2006564 RepID=A0A941F6T9_9BACT|nr:EamA family transporter RarD [Carboxylicivirga sediminis]MBR8537876.1 EamA family transporter RarD [Carboxylicivirga sediminis]